MKLYCPVCKKELEFDSCLSMFRCEWECEFKGIKTDGED